MRSRHVDKYLPQAIAGLEGSVAVRSVVPLDQRDAGRAPFEALVSYFSCDMSGVSRGKGSLDDLSNTGCKIAGPPLAIGSLGMGGSSFTKSVFLASVDLRFLHGAKMGMFDPLKRG